MFTKAKKSVKSLFTHKVVDVLKPPQENNYFDMMPIDILIPIFNNLELIDVMNSENISQQTQEAAASYYRSRFSVFYFNSRSLSSVACCNDQNHTSNLSFAKIMLRVIGPYIRELRINYPSFCIDWVRPLSKMIHEYCGNLTHVYITGIPDHRIKMVNTQHAKVMGVFDCLFDKQPTLKESSKLLKLHYRFKKNGSTTDIIEIIRKHPYITDLCVYMNSIKTAQLRSIASLSFLKILVVHIYRRDSVKEMQLQESIDFSTFFRNLQILPRIAYVELRLPFYTRLPREIIDTSVKSLRRKCRVDLTAVADCLEPKHIQSLRADLDGLNGIRCFIKSNQTYLLTSLLSCLRLEVLRLFLCGQKDTFHMPQIDEVLAALVEGARNECCCLRILEVTARYTEPVGIEHRALIVDYLKTAKHMKMLRLINCTAELIKRKSMLRTENVFVRLE